MSKNPFHGIKFIEFQGILFYSPFEKFEKFVVENKG